MRAARPQLLGTKINRLVGYDYAEVIKIPIATKMSLSGARLPGALLGRASTPGTIKVHERDRVSVFFRSPPITLPQNDLNSRETAWS